MRDRKCPRIYCFSVRAVIFPNLTISSNSSSAVWLWVSLMRRFWTTEKSVTPQHTTLHYFQGTMCSSVGSCRDPESNQKSCMVRTDPLVTVWSRMFHSLCSVGKKPVPFSALESLSCFIHVVKQRQKFPSQCQIGRDLCTDTAHAQQGVQFRIQQKPSIHHKIKKQVPYLVQ